MTKDVNKVTLEGNISQDVQVRGVNKNVAVWSLVTNSIGKDDTKYPAYHKCVTFSKQNVDKIAELGKGSRIRVEGEIAYGKYTNKDGVEVHKTEIKVWGLEVVTPKPKIASTSAPEYRSHTASEEEFSLEDVPF